MARTARERINGDPLTAAIYAALLDELDRVGEYQVEEKQSSIHLVNRRAFLGVHPRKGALLLNIVLDHPLDSPRLHRTEQVSASRWHHEVLLHSPHDIDSELTTWIAAAHALTVPGSSPS
jgi:hypothetical protein